MLSILWEIVLPLLIAFVVGWGIMGWLTWRWRRANVSKRQWERVNQELAAARTQLGEAETKVAGLEAARLVTAVAGSSGNGRRVRPAASTLPAAAPVEEPPEPPQVDDLKAIRGIGLKMEAKLNELGITSLRQVAAFTDEEIARVSAGIAFPGRIERDRWIQQAKELVTRLPDDQPS